MLLAKDCVELFATFPDIAKFMVRKDQKDKATKTEKAHKDKEAKAKKLKKANSKMTVLLGFDDEESKAAEDKANQIKQQRSMNCCLRARLDLMKITNTESGRSTKTVKGMSFRAAVMAKIQMS